MCIGAHVFRNTILIDNSILRQPSTPLICFYIWPYGASAEKKIFHNLANKGFKKGLPKPMGQGTGEKKRCS